MPPHLRLSPIFSILPVVAPVCATPKLAMHVGLSPLFGVGRRRACARGCESLGDVAGPDLERTMGRG